MTSGDEKVANSVTLPRSQFISYKDEMLAVLRIVITPSGCCEAVADVFVILVHRIILARF